MKNNTYHIDEITLETECVKVNNDVDSFDDFYIAEKFQINHIVEEGESYFTNAEGGTFVGQALECYMEDYFVDYCILNIKLAIFNSNRCCEEDGFAEMIANSAAHCDKIEMPNNIMLDSSVKTVESTEGVLYYSSEYYDQDLSLCDLVENCWNDFAYYYEYNDESDIPSTCQHNCYVDAFNSEYNLLLAKTVILNCILKDLSYQGVDFVVDFSGTYHGKVIDIDDQKTMFIIIDANENVRSYYFNAENDVYLDIVEFSAQQKIHTDCDIEEFQNEIDFYISFTGHAESNIDSCKQFLIDQPDCNVYCHQNIDVSFSQ